MEKIPIAGDHKAFELKAKLIEFMKELGFEPVDLGSYSSDSVDYPLYAKAVAEKISRGKYQRGIVICSSGVGVSITANKFPRVRAALALTEKMAEMARRHNDSNILALGSGHTDIETAKKIVKKWLSTDYDGGSHQKRIDQIRDFEKNLMNELDDVKKNEVKIAASLMCADQLNLLSEVNQLVTAGIDMFHIDIIDGVFANNLSLTPSHVFGLRSHTNLPIEVHLMVKNPSGYITRLAAAGADIVNVHVESDNVSKALDEIKKAGMKAGLAIEADTPIEKLYPYIDKIQYVLFLCVKAGFKARPFIPEVINKIKAFSDHVNGRNINIIVDGSVGPRTITHLYRAGGRIFVGGTSGLFKEGTYVDNIRQMRSYCR